jgi:hypothetical protein
VINACVPETHRVSYVTSTLLTDPGIGETLSGADSSTPIRELTLNLRGDSRK